MEHNQWLNARFDAYANFSGRIQGLTKFDHYSARELRARLDAECHALQLKLGRIDGLIMDNGHVAGPPAP